MVHNGDQEAQSTQNMYKYTQRLTRHKSAGPKTQKKRFQSRENPYKFKAQPENGPIFGDIIKIPKIRSKRNESIKYYQ